MTYQKMKIKLVEEDKVMELSTFKRFVTRYSLLIAGLYLFLGLFSAVLVNGLLSFVLGIICLVGYIFCLDYLIEEKEVLLKVCKYLKFWWIPYILIIPSIVLLKYLLFI